MFHADGRTDGRTNMKKAIVAFRTFANAPNRNLAYLVHVDTKGCRTPNESAQTFR